MKLQSEIAPDLWEAVSTPYESKQYSRAVLEAFAYLRDRIRDRADVDGDGVRLVNEALSGDKPRLFLNKHETESERDAQAGFAEILRGLFKGIRNVYTHERIEVSQETADAVIVFLNYCATVIQKGKGPFVLDEWIERVLDPLFVETEEYADGLVEEVPPKRYSEVLTELYKQRQPAEVKELRNLRLIFRCLVDRAGDEKVGDLIATASGELKRTRDDNTIFSAIFVLPPKLWPRIDKLARQRIENRLIRAIEQEMVAHAGGYQPSRLGFAARSLRGYFTLKDRLSEALLRKMDSDDVKHSAYVAEYFWEDLPFVSGESIGETLKDRWAESICKAVANSSVNGTVWKKLCESFSSMTEEWQSAILEKFKSMPDEYAELLQVARAPQSDLFGRS